MELDEEKIFRKAELLFAQPIAMAAGQILRSRTNKEKLDSCLKAGEILTRYLAGLSLASYVCHSEETKAEELGLINIQGSLAWGRFLEIVRAVHSKATAHPLKKHLAPFKPKKKGKPSPNQCLIDLLKIRNDLGHALSTLTEAQSLKYLQGSKSVLTKLAEGLKAMEYVLLCPLLIVEETNYLKKQFHTRLLWLMGQSPDPEPVELVLTVGIDEIHKPYVAVGNYLLNIWPFFIWDMSVENLNRYALFLLDQISEKHLVLKPIEPFKMEINGDALKSMQSMLQAKRVIPETAQTSNGQTIHAVWIQEQKHRSAAHEKWEGRIPWDEFDNKTIEWYAQQLNSRSEKTSEQIVQDQLFEGQERFDVSEIRQVRLLFGDDKSVAKVLRRDLIDLRTVGADSVRWDERINKRVNVLTALRLAVDFFANHLKIDNASVHDLAQTEGSADYLAMRETLVNLFIHQDYTDERSAAQVELKPQCAMFSNAGYSLVPYNRITEGGKSQARNPLIARALRLIGFAELAGSGLRALTHAWRQVKRWPPSFESDFENNSFTLTLDWRPVEDYYDALWRDRIGVNLAPEQAILLNLACEPGGVSLQEAAAGTGMTLEGINKEVDYLVLQGLIKKSSDRFYIVEHLKGAAQ